MAAFYHTSLANHFATPTAEIVGKLTSAYSNYHLNQKREQTRTWEDTIQLIKSIYKNLSLEIHDLPTWAVLYEYKIPRRSKRIDVVLLSKTLIFVIEMKNNSSSYLTSDKQQLEDYCLDLRDFHYESKGRPIIPVLLCTEASAFQNEYKITEDEVQTTLLANRNNISDIILEVNRLYHKETSQAIDFTTWNESKYLPTPTIIEAAQALYAGQTVQEISRSEAGAENLGNTTMAVLDAIKEAQLTNSKIICFITGVPGAGKTLAGLNIVHNRAFQNDEKELGVFVSGNSPLVKVLSEALARDFNKREGIAKGEAKRRVKTFIHNVHEFIDEYYHDKKRVPADNLLVYDEAQRAWTKEHKQKKSKNEIAESEPEILMSIMSRLPNWAVIVALVGGGQEINTGEAGLREWGNSLKEKFRSWKVFISPELKQGHHSTGNLTLFENTPEYIQIKENLNLHLRVSIRSYKADQLSNWVSLVLDNNPSAAEKIFKDQLRNYPIYISRSIEEVKDWLKGKERGTRRIGIVASSGGRRLRALGYDPFHGLRGDSSQDELGAWYLNPGNDVRSSNFLEVVATEYAVQGLEIDWAAILWDADLRRSNGVWEFKQFSGTKWNNVSDRQRKQFIINKYRVLMTRAREGMVIFVPEGNSLDQTRLPKFYEETYHYLLSCGIKGIFTQRQ